MLREGRAVRTFSIVATDVRAGDVGVAVASKFLAAGAVVPWASAGAGAVATQSFADASCGPRGLALMRDGLSAQDALQRLLAEQSGASRQQMGLVDARGGAATLTEEGCFEWAGGHVGDGFACQGNFLAGPQVLKSMATTFETTSGPLVRRLFKAIEAGNAAGGDRRGRQSAAIYVAREGGGYLGKNDVLVDLRVDDDTEPVAELGRLLDLHELYFGSTPVAEKISISGDVLAELRDIMKQAGHDPGDGSDWDEEMETALDALVAGENLEERLDLGARTVDPPALAYLRTRFRADNRG